MHPDASILEPRNGSAPPHAEIQAHLEAILASNAFRNSARLSRFLRFAAQNAIEGTRDQLKEAVIGIEVFDRDPSFDPRTDSVVRVEARRLRTKLRDYYDVEGRYDKIRIVIPKGSYVPLFETREPAARPTAGPGLRRWFRWKRWVYAGGAAALILGVVLMHIYWVLLPVTTVAVLPFETHANEGDESAFARMLNDEVSTELAQVEGLRVVARTSTAKFRRGALLRDIGSELRAGTVLEGGVHRVGNRVRITVQLIRVRDNANLWAQTYEREVGDVFAVQRDIARSIRGATESRLLGRTPAPAGGSL